MKAIKTILAVCLLSLTTAANAQKTYVHISYNGTQYDFASDGIALMTMDTKASIGKGSAKATINGAEVDVTWVQLWKDGPKFATMNLGATSIPASGNTYTWTESDSATDAATVNWGSNWKVPTQTDMNELYLAASEDGSSDKVSCTYTTYTEGGSDYGFLFKGKTAGYTGNSLFFPANSTDKNKGVLYYWSGTMSTAEYGQSLSLHYENDNWYSMWVQAAKTIEHCVRPVLK